MKLSDYLIDYSGFNWSELLKSWRWLLPPEFTLWMMNKFGDLFLVVEDGSVYWLRTDEGRLERVASSRDEFCNLIENGENFNNWLMAPLVDRLVGSGEALKEGQCFGFTFSPIVGGEYAPPNIRIKTIEEYIPFLGEFYEQIKDLPDGAKIKINIEP